MFYFEDDKDHFYIWPALAISLSGEFWICVGWLWFEAGWRNGDDGGWGNHAHKGT